MRYSPLITDLYELTMLAGYLIFVGDEPAPRLASLARAHGRA